MFYRGGGVYKRTLVGVYKRTQVGVYKLLNSTVWFPNGVYKLLNSKILDYIKLLNSKIFGQKSGVTTF